MKFLREVQEMDCIFCKIASGVIKSNVAYEDTKVIAFYDLDPQAPVHFLVVPKTHIASTNDINESNCEIIGHIFAVISKLAKELCLEDGYRIVNNCGVNGGQTVNHLHFHVLGKRLLSWPPG